MQIKWLIVDICRYCSSFTTFKSSWLYLFMFVQFLFEAFLVNSSQIHFPPERLAMCICFGQKPKLFYCAQYSPNRWVKLTTASWALERKA